MKPNASSVLPKRLLRADEIIFAIVETVRAMPDLDSDGRRKEALRLIRERITLEDGFALALRAAEFWGLREVDLKA